MSDSDDNGIQTLARNNYNNNDPENHSVTGKSSTESVRERPAKPRITVEYERVGSFDVFETICPLEFSGFPSPTPPPPPTPSPHRTARSKRRPRGKSTSNKKPLKTITIVDNLTSDSEDEITAAFNQKMLNLTEPPPVIMSIYLDTFFRSENPNVMEPESQATVFWAKGDSVKIPTCPPEDSESDLDPEIARYIEAQKEKKYNGENVTGESLWYDQDRSLIRNLHPNGSISLTSYGDTDEKIFGKTEVFDTILTPQERAMLQARNADETFLKTAAAAATTTTPASTEHKKKKGSDANNKKLKKHHHHQQQHHQNQARPKDQGDWV